MNLTDQEILDLNELCNSLIDGKLTDAEHNRLEAWLAESETAREFYVMAMDGSASLASFASEIQMEAPDVPVRAHGLARMRVWRLAAIAATIVLACTLLITARARRADHLAIATAPKEYVARLSGNKASVWAGESAAIQPGVLLRRGQRLTLAEGFAEITFDSGAQIVLEGPAELDIDSAWKSTLRRGVLSANVPLQAIGFRISNAAVDVVDQGTVFSMVTDGESAEVVVLDGEVEAIPHGDADKDAIMLRTNESRSFASTGLSDTKNHEQLVARFANPVALESLRQPLNYAHWSLDESGREPRRAEAVGLRPARFELTFLEASDAAITMAQTRGIHNNSLRFEGELVANAEFPGLSGNSPRTIAFWVKVPKNSPLTSAYSMVAWRASSEKLGFRPVHISWNREPSEGPLGALRTDFSGGHAMGMVSLRDGLWHYVSVVFVPGEDSDAPVQVKQYVDGRLESNTVTIGPRRSIARDDNRENVSAHRDLLWLGCRLGTSGPKDARFHGEIDELVVADRSLEPKEIVSLMDGEKVRPPN